MQEHGENLQKQQWEIGARYPGNWGKNGSANTGNHLLVLDYTIFWSRAHQPIWNMVCDIDIRCHGLNCVPQVHMLMS